MRISIVLATSILLLSCSERYPAHPNYQLTGQQSGYFSRTDDQGNLLDEQFGLTFKLTSNYDTLPAIYLMTCSWTDLATTNDEKVGLGTSCDANYMRKTTIKSDEYLQLKTITFSRRRHPHADVTKSRFRVALIAIDTTELDFGFYLFDPRAESYLDSMKSQKERFIWSNEIQLQRTRNQGQLPWGTWEKKKALKSP